MEYIGDGLVSCSAQTCVLIVLSIGHHLASFGHVLGPNPAFPNVLGSDDSDSDRFSIVPGGCLESSKSILLCRTPRMRLCRRADLLDKRCEGTAW